MVVVGVDPGRAKAGYAVVDGGGVVLTAGIEPVATLKECLARVTAQYDVSALALGGGTNARAVAADLRQLGYPLYDVDEYETTRRARELFFTEHPPRGWRRFVPLGLQVPPRPVDDYAAILIARRFLAEGGTGKISKVKPPS